MLQRKLHKLTSNATHVVSALVGVKWFQMLLTLVVMIGFIILTVTHNTDAANTFEKFSLIAFGYWFGQLGSGMAIANRVAENV